MIGFMSFKLKIYGNMNFRTTQCVAFSSGVNCGENFVKITLIFFDNQEEEIISWKLVILIKTLKKRQIIVSAARVVDKYKVSCDGFNI